MRQTNNDLNRGNPYNQVRNPQIDNFEEIKARVVEMCRKRSSNGIRGLRIMFKAMDRNRNGSLDPVEFKYAMRDYGVDITEKECAAIVKYFDSWESLGMNGDEQVTIQGLSDLKPRQNLDAEITYADGSKKTISLLVRIDTEDELDYYRAGGILHYVLRNLNKAA